MAPNPTQEVEVVREKLDKNFYLDDGVSKWSVVYPVGNGPRQSPIDIQSGRAVLDDKLKPISVQYGRGCVTSVSNTGNSFKVDVDDKVAKMTGGALSGNPFRLIQFHAHWGTTAGAKGSEHTVNGRLYDAELHLVHWNTKYGDFGSAVSQPDGLAVIGIFLEIGDEGHPEFEKVIELFSKIPYRDMAADYKCEVDPAKFLPDDLSYWHYEGSLTTPPLLESVLWHVVRTPITISKAQLNAMASLRMGTCAENDHSCIVNNFRPPVPLGTRTVKLFTGEKNAGAGEDDKTAGDLAREVSDMRQALEELRKEVAQLKP